MRVNSHVLDAYGQRGVDRAGEASSEAARRTETSTAAKSDSTQAATLSISSEAKRLATIGAPPDPDKVAAIRSRIEAGEFQIDATTIAKRVLDRLA